MLATIAHRGPDGEGVWHEGRVAFGHRRLSIIDLTEASDQPMLTADRTGVLVYNGEVYNYPELRRELEREGVQFRSAGDVEVVLQALHHWGPERSIPRFDGMFALAYLDRREGALWLARDRVGIKPLVVADTGTDLLFASEAKALLAHPRMQSLPDRHAIATSILSRGFGSTRLLFAGIDALEPGSWWKVTENGIAKHRYFHVLTALDVDRLVAASAMDPASFVSSFRDVLKRSVGLHLASDVPLAAMCSGGVDSSLIAAYAKEQLPGIQAYVADVIGPDAEGNQAERVGRHLGFPVQRVIVDRARFLALWPISVWHSDGPPNHSSDPALLAVTQKCRADGIKVLLTGEGCDELFGGYHWYQTTYSNWSRVSSWRRHFTPGRKARKALIHSPFASMVQTSAKFRNRLIVALDADEGLLPRRILALLEPVESVADRAFIANTLCNLHDYLTGILHRHDLVSAWPPRWRCAYLF
jgi:asparagine synthase (glutamine-hydrolysing)